MAPTTNGFLTNPSPTPPIGIYVLVTVDTANRIGENNRPRLYIDGSESVDYTYGGAAASGFPDNAQTALLQSGAPLFVGANGEGVNHFDGYMAELYVVDGTVLTPSDVMSQTTQLRPATFTGELGVNGFYLALQQNATQVKNLDSKLHVRAVGTMVKDHSNQAHQMQTMGTAQVKSGVGNPHDSSGISIFFDGQSSYLTIPITLGFIRPPNASP